MKDDTISRQWLMECVEEGWIKFDTQEDENRFVHLIRDIAPSALENLPSAQQWIPCSERLPEEDHWLGGSGRQFSEKVMVTIVNHSDEDTWVDMTQTIDGEWACELPKYCEIVAWMPLPDPWKGENELSSESE